MFRRLVDWWHTIRREAEVPPPPFRACKRVGDILYGVWYGRLTPDQARAKAAEWGFSSEATEDMISQATQPPSYWSRQPRQQ